jgi:hypothetical protein
MTTGVRQGPQSIHCILLKLCYEIGALVDGSAKVQVEAVADECFTLVVDDNNCHTPTVQ